MKVDMAEVVANTYLDPGDLPTPLSRAPNSRGILHITIAVPWTT
jgi:hypothetical protein